MEEVTEIKEVLANTKEEIMECIRKNTYFLFSPKLNEMTLFRENIADSGAKIISNALKYNTTLTSLSLSNNIIGDQGACDLASALRLNTTLTTLDLGGNVIHALGTIHLAAVLLSNTTLTKFILSCNPIGEMGGKVILRMLTYNSSITFFQARGCEGVSRTFTKDVAERLKKENKSVAYESERLRNICAPRSEGKSREPRGSSRIIPLGAREIINPESNKIINLSDGTESPEKSVGNTNPRGSVRNTNPSESVGNISPSGTVGNTSPRGTVVNTNPSESVGNTSPRGYVGNTKPRGSVGNTNTSESVGNSNPSESVGNTKSRGSVGNTNTSESVGKTKPRGSVGNTNTSESFGNTKPSESVGNTNPSESVGNKSPRGYVGNTSPRGYVGNTSPRENVGNKSPREFAGNTSSKESKNSENQTVELYLSSGVSNLSWYKPKIESINTEKFQKIEVTPATNMDDWNFVTSLWEKHSGPVMKEKYLIDKIFYIKNQTFDKAWDVACELLEYRSKAEIFNKEVWKQKIKWEKQPLYTKQREAILQRLQNFILYDSMEPDSKLKIIPLWHGTRLAYVDSICTNGLANLATTDDGYFGKGIYGTPQAEYATRVYSTEENNKGVCFLCLAVVANVFPVLHEDSDHIMGSVNINNSDAHYAPVRPRDKNNQNETVYLAMPAGDLNAVYDELIVFQESHIIPRFIVHFNIINKAK